MGLSFLQKLVYVCVHFHLPSFIPLPNLNLYTPASGATRILMLYTWTTKENVKKGCKFLRLNAIFENRDWGSKCAYFQEKGVFLDSLGDIKRSFSKLLYSTKRVHNHPPPPNKNGKWGGEPKKSNKQKSLV